MCFVLHVLGGLHDGQQAGMHKSIYLDVNSQSRGEWLWLRLYSSIVTLHALLAQLVSRPWGGGAKGSRGVSTA